jgi:sugar (pentulose or hexulose) kinase
VVHYPNPGQAELEPEAIWRAACQALRQLSFDPSSKKDPPQAMAISASGDEVFPIDAAGHPLTTCLLSGDSRGEAIKQTTLSHASPSEWMQACGHIPDRMDPVNRILWLREEYPEIYGLADRFVGWHEFLTLHLCGKVVVDPSLAAKWFVFDLHQGKWSKEALASFGLDMINLPEVYTWGQEIGELLPEVARETGMPSHMLVCVGGYDSACAALGTGAVQTGVAGLACGSWEVVVAPVLDLQSLNSLATHNLSMIPYYGQTPWAALAQSPNGAVVIDWSASLTRFNLTKLEHHLQNRSLGPGKVLAIPHLSGALAPWINKQDSHGALFGLTLATKPLDIFQAMMEGVALDLAITIQILSTAGLPLNSLRASGGGTYSNWWMQLKADLTGLPVEVAETVEPGAWGAALLAGAAIGLFTNISRSTRDTFRIKQRFEPNPARRDLYAQRLEQYTRCVLNLSETEIIMAN